MINTPFNEYCTLGSKRQHKIKLNIGEFFSEMPPQCLTNIVAISKPVTTSVRTLRYTVNFSVFFPITLGRTYASTAA